MTNILWILQIISFQITRQKKVKQSMDYCRIYSGWNSNMHIERMCRTIKYVYLEATKIKRLDKCLMYTLKFLHNEVFKRLIMKHKRIVSIKLKDLRNRHKNQQVWKIWLL